MPTMYRTLGSASGRNGNLAIKVHTGISSQVAARAVNPVEQVRAISSIST
ncbi:hypothetical protein FVER14953_20224 [Fusarium verticillioides]|nr:hypothetical protein FVER14953_20224 [Fusarium verticillioides]